MNINTTYAVLGDNAILYFGGCWEFLSNFYPSLIEINGKQYATVEHYYQAMKGGAHGAAHESIRKSGTPGEAKRKGNLIKLRPDWENIKEDVMMLALSKKFAAGTGLALELLATEDRFIVEGNTWNDRYWGVCDGRGMNRLGSQLMEIRKNLKEQLKK